MSQQRQQQNENQNQQQPKSAVFFTARDITTSFFGDSKLSSLSGATTSDSSSSNDQQQNNNGMFAAFEKEDFLGETNQKSLRELVGVLGSKIVEYKIQYDPTLRTTGVYVLFDNENGAKAAVESLDGEKFFDFVLNVHSPHFKRQSKPNPITLDTTNNDKNNKTSENNKNEASMKLFLDSVNFSTMPHKLLPFNHLMPASLQMSRKLLDLIEKWLETHSKNEEQHNKQQQLKEQQQEDAAGATEQQQEQHQPTQKDIFTPLLQQLHKEQEEVAKLFEEYEKVKAEKLRRYDELNAGPSKRLIQRLSSSSSFNQLAKNPLLLKHGLIEVEGSSSSPFTYSSSISSILYFSNVEVTTSSISSVLHHLVTIEGLPVQKWALAPCVLSIDIADLSLKYMTAKEKRAQIAKNVALLVQFTNEVSAAHFLDKIYSASGKKNFIFERNLTRVNNTKDVLRVRTMVMTLEDAINRKYLDKKLATKEFGQEVCVLGGNNNDSNASMKKEKQRSLPSHEVEGLFGARESSDLLRDLKAAGI